MNPFRWRKMTWVIWIFTLLMGAWIVVGLASNADVCEDEAAETRAACEVGADIGTGLSVTALFCVWFLGFLILSIAWFMTRPTRRICPQCGTEARRGQQVCSRCGFNFKLAAPTAALQGVPTMPAIQPQTAAAPCPNCGQANPPGARFCGSCGTQL